jgi:uncharacterized membrane protein
MTLFDHKPHEHVTQNLNAVHDDALTVGQRIADSVANGMGSWRFVIIQTIIVILWITSNMYFIVHPWDPWPFILLNLVFSTQAAYASPLILMAQNRQAARDRLTAEHAYQINIKNEEETRQLIEHLGQQDDELLKQTEILHGQNEELMRQTKMLTILVKELVSQERGLS